MAPQKCINCVCFGHSVKMWVIKKIWVEKHRVLVNELDASAKDGGGLRLVIKEEMQTRRKDKLN